MSKIRLFYPKKLSINLESFLDKSQSHYIYKVMRIEEGQKFSLFNETGEWEAEVSNILKKIVSFKVTKQIRQKENEKKIWLAFSPVKSNYFNFMIQKSTELGVTNFFPIITDRTIVRTINTERLNKIIIESSEQSNRINVPSLEKIQSLDNFLKNNNSLNLIFGDLNTGNKSLNVDTKKTICILIGPEGDFSEKERSKILKYKGVQRIKLNDNILRTETAAIAALSVINYLKN